MTNEKISTIDGSIGLDDRGSVRFVNDFSFNEVKRFYQVANFDTNTVRAFHGHLKEAKYVYVPNGSIILCAVKLDNVKNPSQTSPVERFVLSAQKPQIVIHTCRLCERI